MFYFQLMGGLGNQLFQYATAKSLSFSRNSPVNFFFLDTYAFAKRSLLLDRFSLDIELVDDPRTRILPLSQVMEKHCFTYDEQLFHVPDDSVMIGYWQNELYFKQIAGKIRRMFSLKTYTNRFQAISQRIAVKRCPVSIHIRRGDYAEHPEILSIHGLCPSQYYHKAMQILMERLSDIHLFLFSDDIAWVKAHFDVQGLPYDFIEPSYPNPQEDLVLMSLCKHHIIANSSYSWWGAWLNTSPDKIVIAPRQWMTAHYDPPIICSDWTGI
jgi:hypothetical protein